jgi:quinolinate synthase
MTPEALFEKLKTVSVANQACSYTYERCKQLAPTIESIERLKKEKRAIILAHSYVHPDIIYGVADYTGDSYYLAKKAWETEAKVIVFPAVRFMAETAKILNPEKTVIDPNPNGGCTLADSITADEVARLRMQYPSHTFVCYINTSAAVKAHCDICVTSSNAYHIIEALNNDKIYFLPDRLMGENLRNHLKNKGIDKELLFYQGACYVHEHFSVEEALSVKHHHPTLKILAHPECKPDVVAIADKTCSTTGMFDHVKSDPHHPYLLLTECGIAARIQVEMPEAQLLGSCVLCKYMKSNSLDTIEQALRDPHPSQIITLDRSIHHAALACLNAMFEMTQ